MSNDKIQSLQGFHGQPMPSMPHPPAIRPRVRARRGQATDPHSIAERVFFFPLFAAKSILKLFRLFNKGHILLLLLVFG